MHRRTRLAACAATALLALAGSAAQASMGPHPSAEGGTSVPSAGASEPGGHASGATPGARPSTALQTIFSADLNGGYVAQGVAMRNLGYGDIVIDRVPDGAGVAAAYLLWDVLDKTQQDGDAQGAFDSFPITGTLVSTGGSPCWRRQTVYNFAYQADVTDLVAGNGTYALSGFASGAVDGRDPWNSGSPAPQLEGASLVVVYQDATSPLTHVEIAGGARLTKSERTLKATFSGFTAAQPPSAKTTFIVADGQDLADGPATFNRTALSPGDFQGKDRQAVHRYSHGNLWDTATYPVSRDVHSGDTSASATIVGGQDCLVWVGQAFSVAT